MFRYSILFVLGILFCEMLSMWDGIGVEIGVREWILITCVVTASAVLLPKLNVRAGDIATLLMITSLGGLRMSFEKDGMRYVTGKERCEMRLAIISEPVVHGKVIQFDGVVKDDNEGKAKVYAGHKIRCSMMRDALDKYKEVHIGKGLECVVDLSSLEEQVGRNARFDYSRWLKTHDFVARGFIAVGKWDVTEVAIGDIGLIEYVRLMLMRVREKVIKKMNLLGMDESSFAVASAMVLGNKTALTPELRQDYNASGVSHILALSGMHLSIIYAIFAFLLGRGERWKRLSVLGVIWVYVLFVGMPVSVLRAAIVLTLWELVSMFWEEQHPLNIFGMSLMMITVFNPYSLWDVGFQLSFAAILGIVVFMKPIDRLMPEAWRQRNNKQIRSMRKIEIWKYKVLRGGWYIGSVTIAAQLGTAPLVLYHFGVISGLFGLTNFFVMPLSWVVICGTLMVVVLIGIDALVGGAVWGVVCVVGWLLSWVVKVQNNVLGWIAELPFARVDIEINEMQTIVLYVMIVGVGVILNERMWKK